MSFFFFFCRCRLPPLTHSSIIILVSYWKSSASDCLVTLSVKSGPRLSSQAGTAKSSRRLNGLNSSRTADGSWSEKALRIKRARPRQTDGPLKQRRGPTGLPSPLLSASDLLEADLTSVGDLPFFTLYRKASVCPTSGRLETQLPPPKCKNTTPSPPPTSPRQGVGTAGVIRAASGGRLRCLRSAAPAPDPSTALLGKVCLLCPHSKTIYVTAGS